MKSRKVIFLAVLLHPVNLLCMYPKESGEESYRVFSENSSDSEESEDMLPTQPKPLSRHSSTDDDVNNNHAESNKAVAALLVICGILYSNFLALKWVSKL